MARARKRVISVVEAIAGLSVAMVLSRLLSRDCCYAGAYLRGGRPGAEAGARLPGDELLENATMVSTRARTIDAPASAVWPWLVQMGVGRGGAYTYDWVERLLGLDMHSADRVVPELQKPRPGAVLAQRRGLRCSSSSRDRSHGAQDASGNQRAR
ncbi:MAG: hypothetical protein QOJ63_136 [Solirubrobacteraceae bacterium]|nr:hypothetical protein [Solirubrobacteraceae bacterium]